MSNDILADYDSTTADNNTDIGGISIAEGMLPSAVNNSIRMLTKQLGAMADGTDALTALSVDNLKLDGNTLSSTDTNGNITLDPDGTGNVTVVGTLAATAVTGDGSALTGISSVGGATGVSFNDSVKAQFGAGNDLEIYHDGSNSFISDTGTGALAIVTNGANVNIQKSPYEPMIVAHTDGAVDLYHNNALKLATTSTGVDISGDLTLYAEGSNNLRVDVRQGSAKHWIHFNGSNNSVKDSYNHTSITDNGSGDFQMNVNNDFNNDDFTSSGHCSWDGTGWGGVVFAYEGTRGNGYYRIITARPDNLGKRDMISTMLIAHGDLA